MERLQSILLSFDFIAASVFIVAGILLINFGILPGTVKNAQVEKVAALGTTVFSIIFGLFMTGLTVMVTSGSDDFIKFFNENGSYEGILSNLAISASSLFASLMFSLAFSLIASFVVVDWNTWILLVFGFVAVYSLVTTFQVLLDSLAYAKRRAKFLDQ